MVLFIVALIVFIIIDIVIRLIAKKMNEKKILKERGEDISDNPFFERIKSEPAYKEQVFNDVLTSVRKESDTRYEKDLKSGARVIKMY